MKTKATIPKSSWLFLISFLLFGGIALFASPVDQGKASLVAKEFVNSEKIRWEQKPESAAGLFGAKQIAAAEQAYSIADVREIKTVDGTITAYVAELKPKGFVIVSADDEVEPILGFSFQGQFPFGPDHNALLDLVKWDTQDRLGALREAEAHGIVAKAATTASQKWISLLSAAKTGGAQPLIPQPMTYQQWPSNQDGWFNDKIEWSQQSKPWYNDCPLYKGSRCVVGCEATAMAQIIDYWKYPTSAHFSDDDAYLSMGGILGPYIFIDADASTYNFPTFPQLNSLLSTITYNPTNVDEMAALCFGVGVKLHTGYGTNDSYANISDAAYKSGFSYGSAILAGNSIWNNWNVWNAKEPNVINNLKEGWPVQIDIASGILLGGGHSVVLDGYRSDGAFHVNLGWGGFYQQPPANTNDAWYYLPSINTTSFGGSDFELIRHIVYDIAPYQGWSQVGADEYNSFKTIYSGPSAAINKWSASDTTEIRKI